MKQPHSKGALGRLVALMQPFWLQMLLALCCVLVVSGADLLKPLVAEVVLDDFLAKGDMGRGLWSVPGLAIGYLLVCLLGAGCSLLQVKLIARVSQTILNQVRRQVFGTILRLPLAALDRYGTGRLITRATNDVETMNEFYSDVFISLFSDAILLVGILVVMLCLDWRLALVSLTGLPVIAGLTFLLKRRIKRNSREMKSRIGFLNGFFSENIAGMRLVQAFNREADKLREFRAANHAYFRTTRLQVLLNSFLRPTMEVINYLVIAALLLLSWCRITGGAPAPLTIGVVYAFTNYVKQFFAPIDDLAEKYTTIQSALVSTDRIYEILSEPVLEETQGGQGYAGPVRGKVEFRDVWFAYSEEDWVLQGVSFVVQPGQRAALVGHTGAGKSTIISLVSRYYTPQRGQILIDGVAVENWDLAALRRGICTVLQDVFLFTGTIGENIDLDAGLPDETLTAALQAACAGHLAQDAGGLDAAVAEQGLNFSTGERQLLSFARAIAHDPAILVLDEATAHIDSATEALVTRSIAAISQGRTSILIAHRLSTIRDCDVIFVLEGGVVAEAGDHETLYAKGGSYTAFVNARREETEAC